MKKLLWLPLCLFLVGPSIAQNIGPPGNTSSSAPCSAFGTTAGTCAQGNDSRITGAAPLASPSFTGTPTAPTAAAGTNTTQLATTQFTTTAINNAIAGVNPAIAVQAATIQASDTSGLTYNNGVAGIGATFTGSVNTAFTVDGFTFTALNQRVLIKNDTQSPSGAFNGIYYVTQLQTGILPPILTRALDYDQPSDVNNTGSIPVVNGTLNGTTSWLLTSTVATVGTDPLTYTQFSINPNVALPYSRGGTNATSLAAAQQNFELGIIVASATGINFNSVADTAIAFTMPAGFTRIQVLSLVISNASHSLTTATCGVFTATVGGGVAFVATGTAISVSATADQTANNAQNIGAVGTLSAIAGSLATPNTLYFRVTNAEGAAATADISLFIKVLP